MKSILFFLGASVFVCSLLAQAEVTQDVPFRIVTLRGFDPEYHLPVTRYALQLGKVQMDFQPPDKWGASPDEAGHSITFRSPDGKAGILLRFQPNRLSGIPAPMVDPATAIVDLLPRAQALVPSQTLVRQASATAAGIPGGIFEFAQRSTNGIVLRSRVGIFQNSFGCIELSLKAIGDLSKYHGAYNGLRNSLSISKLPTAVQKTSDQQN